MLLGLFMYHFAMRPHKKCEQCKFTNSTVRKTFLRLFSRTGNAAERDAYPAVLGVGTALQMLRSNTHIQHVWRTGMIFRGIGTLIKMIAYDKV